MPSDFADAGRRFEAALRIPELPITSIRNRSRAKRARHHWHLVIACALALLVMVGSGAVLAAKLSGIRIWLSGNNATVAFHSLATIVNPTAEDLRRVIADATFTVVLPVGLPTGVHLNRLIFSPADHPNVITLQYGNGKGASGWGFVLVDSSTVERGAIPPLAKIATVKQWSVGGETVIMANSNQFASQATIEAAMLRATPPESFAQTLPTLYRITLLNDYSDSFRLADIPNTIAPVDGRSVLIDREHLALIPGLAQERKPLFFVRMETIDNIPTVPTGKGYVDLGNASHHADKVLAVSVDGVRAIAAVLATNTCGSAPKFTCEILFNERSGHAYRIWALPLRSPASPVKYAVDPTTLQANQEK